jgi:lysozyme
MTHSTFVADLSNNNSFYDPVSYRAAGHVLVALKASEGTGFADPDHRLWALHSGLHGIAVAHYHFGRPDLSTGKDEADWFLHCTSGLLGPHDYVVYDGERARDGAFGLDPQHCRQFDDRIRELTRFEPILYASASQLGAGATDALGGPNRRDWCADYSSGPDTAAPGHRCVMRQFTDGVIGPDPHVLPGVGQCDVNIMRGAFARTVLANASRR